MERAIPWALIEMYGVVGSATLVYEFCDFASLDEGLHVLRVPVKHYQKVWAAITMIPKVDGFAARLVVEKATPFLFALFEDT